MKNDQSLQRKGKWNRTLCGNLEVQLSWSICISVKTCKNTQTFPHGRGYSLFWVIIWCQYTNGLQVKVYLQSLTCS
jgi:hypothetical protein